MNTTKIFLIIFSLATIVHITAILLGKEKLRQISKCLIIPPLLAAYAAGSEIRIPFIIPALVLGWIGDVLLLKIDKSAFFKLGLCSFLLGHICYIIAFIYLLGLFGFGGMVPIAGTGSINIPAILIFTPPAIVLGAVVIRLIKPTKEMRFPVIFYMVVLETLTLFGFQIFLFNPGIAGLLILSGCLCFMVSDTILAYYTFRKLKLSGAVLIMAYYILAQAEIIFGLMSLQ